MSGLTLPTPGSLSTGQCATLACLLEVAAPKPGNVHRGADFDDVGLEHFLASAVAIGAPMEAAESQLLGRTVLAAVQATHDVAGTNTNLGTILLLAPLAKVPRTIPLATGVSEVLRGLGPEDAALVYEAIRLAKPGGLGVVERHDVAGPAPPDLIGAMREAGPRDLVARQYANGFAQVLGDALPQLRAGLRRGWPLAETIVHVHLRLMAEYPDSLIARKCGLPVAQQASAAAATVLAAGQPGDEGYQACLSDLDFWLRSDGHRRNPGTTADLLSAALFALLRDG